MKTLIRLITLALPLGLLVCLPAAGQLNLTGGQDDVTDVRLGVYHHESNGNQDWVREYDGRPFDLGIEQLNSYGYSGPLSFWLDVRDLVVQDETIDFNFGLGNTLGIILGTDKLTHRLDRIPPVNPFLADTPAAGGDVFTELAPGSSLNIDRRVNNIGLNLTPGPSRRVRIVGDWWEEDESGAQQVLFYSISPGSVFPGETPPPPGGRARFGSALLIDRSTTEGTLGTDLELGKSSALSYRFTNINFGDSAAVAPPGTGVFPPLNRITQPRVNSAVNKLKGRSRINDKLFFSGAFVDRDRDNRTSTLGPLGVLEPRTNRIGVSSTNLALSYLATDSLSLTGRYRRYKLDNLVPPVLVGGLPENQAVSREESSLSLDASYTGIRRAIIRATFERRDTDREVSPLHAGHEEFEHPFTSQATDTNIWRLGARYYPTTGLSLSANLEKWDIDSPGYQGTPTDRDNLSLEATYLIRDNFAVYGNFYRWDEKNVQIRVPLASIPTPATDADEQDQRISAAGQGYDNDQKSANIGAWYALTSKLTMDVNYGKNKVDAGALWVIGTDPAFLPHLFPDFAPYRADNTVWNLGLTYAFRPNWRVYSRFLNSDSDGETLIDLTTSAGADLPVGPVWTPIDVRERRYTIGFGYNLSASEELFLDFSLSDWADRIDGGNSGRFNLWRIAWAHRY